MLFSATMPGQIVKISKKYMQPPKKDRVDAKEMVASKIKQLFYEVREGDKVKALTRILDVQDPALTLIFCHTKRDVDDLAGKLQTLGYDAGAIHGDFTQSARDDMMRKFKSGDIDILVATDVAARGLDINDVTHVFNYAIPQNPDAYVHRIGRTGRAGKHGIAITFVTPREYRHLRLIERIAKTKITKGKLPTKDEVHRAREKELIEEIDTVMEEGSHRRFFPLVKELEARYELEELAAAAIGFIMGDMEVEHINEARGESGARTERGRTTGKAGMTRLFLTIGRKDRIKVGDIVKAIAMKSKMPGKNIGNIALFDDYCFVEVPSSMADQVVAKINNMVVSGRKVRVKPAHEKAQR